MDKNINIEMPKLKTDALIEIKSVIKDIQEIIEDEISEDFLTNLLINVSEDNSKFIAELSEKLSPKKYNMFKKSLWFKMNDFFKKQDRVELFREAVNSIPNEVKSRIVVLDVETEKIYRVEKIVADLIKELRNLIENLADNKDTLAKDMQEIDKPSLSLSLKEEQELKVVKDFIQVISQALDQAKIRLYSIEMFFKTLTLIAKAEREILSEISYLSVLGMNILESINGSTHTKRSDDVKYTPSKIFSLEDSNEKIEGKLVELVSIKNESRQINTVLISRLDRYMFDINETVSFD